MEVSACLLVKEQQQMGVTLLLLVGLTPLAQIVLLQLLDQTILWRTPTVFKCNALASTWCFCFGRNTTASGSDSLAFGSQATSSGSNTIAIASDTDATGNSSVAIGNGAQSTALYNCSWKRNNATSTGATAIGYLAQAVTGSSL